MFIVDLFAPKITILDFAMLILLELKNSGVFFNCKNNAINVIFLAKNTFPYLFIKILNYVFVELELSIGNR